MRNTPGYKKLHDKLHDTCLLCGQNNPIGFKLEFTVTADGWVHAGMRPPFTLEGYKGHLHGGVIAALLDSAMANALLSKGITALTAELTIKYKCPVYCGRPLEVSAVIENDMSPLYLLKAEITQNGTTAVTAKAKFMLTDKFAAAAK